MEPIFSVELDAPGTGRARWAAVSCHTDPSFPRPRATGGSGSPTAHRLTERMAYPAVHPAETR